MAFAAIGTGLIHLALVIGAPLPLGIALGLLGLAEFVWGVLTFARDTVPLPRVALVVAIAPVVLWGLLLAVAIAAELPALAASLPLLPFAIATVFELFIAATLAVHLRREPGAIAPAPSVARYLVGLGAGALVVAALTTPAIAATQAGQLGQPPSYEFDTPPHDDGH